MPQVHHSTLELVYKAHPELLYVSHLSLPHIIIFWISQTILENMHFDQCSKLFWAETIYHNFINLVWSESLFYHQILEAYLQSILILE